MIGDVIGRLYAALDEPTDLREIAREACLSPYHFHRVFRGMVGETPGELVRRLRLERAAWQLRETDRPVTEIAFDAGFESHEAFTRAFGAAYNRTPSGFRREGTLRIHLPASCAVHYNPTGVVADFIPRDSGGKNMNVEIVSMPEMRLATVRHTGPYNQIPAAFEQLCRIAGPAGLFNGPGASCLAIYYDDPESVPPAELRSDAAVAIAPGVEVPEGLDSQVLAGGPYAKAIHTGPYPLLGDTWSRFMGEWLPASGHQAADGPAFELYVSDPESTPEAELRTELYVPLRD
jgi:AraC family transcriptional regulator